MPDSSKIDRLDRIEAQLAIQQLAARYSLAVDSKDLDGLVRLFVEDVNAGRRWGVGRDALKAFYVDALSSFYRSMHLVSGHVIEIDDADHAHGVVHCRAEHEAGGRWGIMVMTYSDDYERRDGEWQFRRRRLQPLYASDILERPQGSNFTRGWQEQPADEPRDGTGSPARFPAEFPTFAEYWKQFPAEHVAGLTREPVRAREES